MKFSVAFIFGKVNPIWTFSGFYGTGLMSFKAQKLYKCKK